MRSKNKDYLGLELSHELLERLKSMAAEKELSISAFIRTILIDYLKRVDDSTST